MKYEVEKKYFASDEEIELVTRDAVLARYSQWHQDAYYDTPEYALLAKPAFLRERNGQFELKAPVLDANKGNQLSAYKEYVEEEEIRRFLSLNALGKRNLRAVLERNNYSPFAEFATQRAVYWKEGFTVCLDLTDFGLKVIEIELLVKRKAEIAAAKEKVTAFAHQYGLGQEFKTGKLIEFLRINNQEAYQILAQTGIYPGS